MNFWTRVASSGWTALRTDSQSSWTGRHLLTQNAQRTFPLLSCMVLCVCLFSLLKRYWISLFYCLFALKCFWESLFHCLIDFVDALLHLFNYWVWFIVNGLNGTCKIRKYSQDFCAQMFINELYASVIIFKIHKYPHVVSTITILMI